MSKRRDIGIAEETMRRLAPTADVRLVLDVLWLCSLQLAANPRLHLGDLTMLMGAKRSWFQA